MRRLNASSSTSIARSAWSCSAASFHGSSPHDHVSAADQLQVLDRGRSHAVGTCSIPSGQVAVIERLVFVAPSLVPDADHSSLAS
jgi:hypothetical protein